MAQAIVSFSLQTIQGPERTVLQQEARRVLEDAGFRLVSTSSYEATNVPIDRLAQALSALIVKLGSERLDHLWIYMGRQQPSN